MPELPEVEHLRRSLEPSLVGSRIVAVHVRRSDIVRNRPGRTRVVPADLLDGATVRALDRRGKQLAIFGDGGSGLVVQLGMSGQLRWATGGSPPGANDHVHVRWQVVNVDGSTRWLEFRDPRRFGGLSPFESRPDLDERLWARLGPDAATGAIGPLAARRLGAAHGSRRSLKSMLLDQSVVAGIGNIYADEALFSAGIHPGLVAGRLTADLADRLAREILRTLHEAIDAGGSTLRDYVDATGRAGSFQESHRVYGRGGQPCPRCRSTIRSAPLSGRTTSWCPTCQSRSIRRTGSSRSST